MASIIERLFPANETRRYYEANGQHLPSMSRDHYTMPKTDYPSSINKPRRKPTLKKPASHCRHRGPREPRMQASSLRASDHSKGARLDSPDQSRLGSVLSDRSFHEQFPYDRRSSFNPEIIDDDSQGRYHYQAITFHFRKEEEEEETLVGSPFTISSSSSESACDRHCCQSEAVLPGPTVHSHAEDELFRQLLDAVRLTPQEVNLLKTLRGNAVNSPDKKNSGRRPFEVDQTSTSLFHDKETAMEDVICTAHQKHAKHLSDPSMISEDTNQWRERRNPSAKPEYQGLDAVWGELSRCKTCLPELQCEGSESFLEDFIEMNKLSEDFCMTTDVEIGPEGEKTDSP